MTKTFNLSDIVLRIINPADSVEEINALLLSAYKPLAEAGMRYAASHEDAEATRRNIEDGECHLGIFQHKIVSCAVLRIPNKSGKTGWKANGPIWYISPGVATFGRFAVSPELQGLGLGSQMMNVLERRAKELGFSELALDTSEHADQLIKMYKKRNYRFIEFHQWSITNYRSVVLSKAL